MAIKTEVKEADTSANNYPILKKGTMSGQIVLFASHRAGVVVVAPPGSGVRIGHSTNSFKEEAFEVFNGTVTLSNE